MSEKNNQERFQEHASVGYANVQETIRFLDTKAGALIGLVTLVTGLPLVVMQWILDKDETSPFCLSSLQGNHPTLTNTLAVILFAGLASGVTSLWYALEVTVARPASHKSNSRSKKCHKHTSNRRRATVLFAIGDSYADRSYILKKERDGLTSNEIDKEFGFQLIRVGNIAGKKVRYLRNAVIAFKTQLALNVVCLGACFVAYVVMLTAQMGTVTKSDENPGVLALPVQPTQQIASSTTVKFVFPIQPPQTTQP